MNLQISKDEGNYIFSFPNLPPIRKRGRFVQDKNSLKVAECRKQYKGHPRLRPGIFTIYCLHGKNGTLLSFNDTHHSLRKMCLWKTNKLTTAIFGS